MPFKDRFSAHADKYAQFRPHYPRALFQYLAEISPARTAAWDCATGNGQAAVPLAEFFESVIATDASEEQIANAERHERITYHVTAAEHSDLESESVDLITVAQALHWFERYAFYAEAKRVLKPNGLLAVWCYNLFRISPEIDRILGDFYHATVGPYWDFERKLVEAGYSTIDFPFDELPPPAFHMEAEWSLLQVLGYLRTWSATQNFIAAQNFDPVTELEKSLGALWDDPETTKMVAWPIGMRIGRVTVPATR
jgi:SAM-dependent methyltransferase